METIEIMNNEYKIIIYKYKTGLLFRISSIILRPAPTTTESPIFILFKIEQLPTSFYNLFLLLFYFILL